MPGLLINIPLPGGSERVPAMLYAPKDSTRVVGIVIVAPGSSGGTGPGIDRGRDGLPLAKSQTSAAFGSIYRRLGCELADAGTIYDWRASPIDAAVIAAGGTGGRSSITAAPAISRSYSDALFNALGGALDPPFRPAVRQKS